MTNLSPAFTRLAPEAEHTVEVPATGTYVAEDGNVYEAQLAHTNWYACACTDGLHIWPTGRTILPEWDEAAARRKAARDGWHVVPEHVYSFLGAVAS